MSLRTRVGSSSIEQPDHWWYRARADLLQAALGEFLGSPDLLLDVGSADGPSVEWMREGHRAIGIDVDPRGLRAGEGVCASALALPFAAETFDVVGAFDVIEHCEPEGQALGELARVLMPGGQLLMSVPAYQWAWSDHDARAGHHRRYTEARLVSAVEEAGFVVRRSTYGFAAVFPLFAAERLSRRLRRPSSRDPGLTVVPTAVDAVLMRLCALDGRVLRRRDIPFGSSIFLAAEKPAPAKEQS